MNRRAELRLILRNEFLPVFNESPVALHALHSLRNLRWRKDCLSDSFYFPMLSKSNSFS